VERIRHVAGADGVPPAPEPSPDQLRRPTQLGCRIPVWRRSRSPDDLGSRQPAVRRPHGSLRPLPTVKAGAPERE